jgi:hypothetical protein
MINEKENYSQRRLPSHQLIQQSHHHIFSQRLHLSHVSVRLSVTQLTNKLSLSERLYCFSISVNLLVSFLRLRGVADMIWYRTLKTY